MHRRHRGAASALLAALLLPSHRLALLLSGMSSALAFQASVGTVDAGRGRNRKDERMRRRGRSVERSPADPFHPPPPPPSSYLAPHGDFKPRPRRQSKGFLLSREGEQDFIQATSEEEKVGVNDGAVGSGYALHKAATENDADGDGGHYYDFNLYGNGGSTGSKVGGYRTQKEQMDTASTEWMHQNTKDLLDEMVVPLGQLTGDDVSTITGLMAAWAKSKSKEGARTVERLLKRIVDDMNSGNVDVRVTTRMYTMSIDAWAKVGGIAAAERAHIIHEGMMETNKKTGDPLIRPTTISYNALLNSWSKSRSSKAPLVAEAIFHEMLERYRRGDDAVRPDVVSFTAVIDAWAKSGKPGAGHRALNLLQIMEDLSSGEREERDEVKPNVYTYSAAINAFAKSPDVDAPQKAENLLKYMKQRCEAGDWQSKPNSVNYNSCINAWGRSKEPGSAKKATAILERMLRPAEEGGDDVEPDFLSFSLAVSAWAHSADPESTRRSEEMLLRMERWAISKKRSLASSGALPHHRIELDVEAYNAVLIGLSRCQEQDAPRRALAILRRMLDLAETGFESARPTSKSWNSVLNTFSRTREPGIAQKAEQLLKWMIREGSKPDAFSFAAVLHAYQKNSEAGAAHRADAIVREMEKRYQAGQLGDGPDVFHYTIVCACWAKSGERIAARRCAQILDHMNQQFEDGNAKIKPNIRTFNAVIDAHARSKDVEEAEKILFQLLSDFESGEGDLKPDAFTFNAVINAWTRTRRRDGGTRAEAVLDKLLNFHRNGNAEILPDSRSFSHIVDYYTRQRELDAPMKAEKMLNRMIEMYEAGYTNLCPNIYPFTNVINAYANSKQPYSGKCAERVLRKMTDLKKRHNLGRLKVTSMAANAVLQAWANTGESNAGEMAEAILNEMEKEYHAGNPDIKPSTRSYGLAISAWAKSRVNNKAHRALSVLNRMVREYKGGNDGARPNVQAYNSCINACAFTDGPQENQLQAFDLAKSIVQELYDCEFGAPTGATFGTFIKACGRLNLPRDIVAENLESSFLKCRDMGLVNDFVLTQLRYSSPDGLYRQLLGDDIIPRDGPEKIRVEVENIPLEWRRNVPDKIK